MKIVKLFVFVFPILILFACESENSLAKSEPILEEEDIDFTNLFEKTRTVKVDSTIDKVDLYLLSELGELRLNLPPNFINSINIDTTVVEAYGEYKTEGSKGYVYDSKGRVVNYYNTSCIVCSFLGFDYDVTDNHLNQVISIIDKHSNSVHEISYDSEGDIKVLTEYSGEEKFLVLQIEKI